MIKDKTNKNHFSILVSLILILLSQSTYAEKRIALVIGNGNYEFGKLKNPVNDANDITKILVHSGFEVDLQINVSQEGMDVAIRRFGKSLKKGGVGLFYYAGHGVQSNGVNYLIPVGAPIENELDVKYKSVNVGRVLDEMGYASICSLNRCRLFPPMQALLN